MPDKGFIHIFNHHSEDFESFFSISDPRDIAELIFTTITNNNIYVLFSGLDPLNLVFVYRVSGKNLHVVVDADGYILTAYPSRS